MNGEKPWGANIHRAYMKPIDPGKTVNAARSNAAAAVSQKKVQIEQAEGVRDAIKLKADAEAYAEEKLGEAKAKAFAAVAKELKTPEGLLAAQIEAAKEVLSKAGTIIVPDNLAGITASLGKIFNKTAT